MNEINVNKIKIYDFPEPEDEEESKLLKSFKSRVPFAVVGSNYVLEVAGERKRGRKYPWGLVESMFFEHVVLELELIDSFFYSRKFGTLRFSCIT